MESGLGEHKTKDFFYFSPESRSERDGVFWGWDLRQIFFISAQQGILKEMVVPKKADFFFVPAGEQFWKRWPWASRDFHWKYVKIHGNTRKKRRFLKGSDEKCAEFFFSAAGTRFWKRWWFCRRPETAEFFFSAAGSTIWKRWSFLPVGPGAEVFFSRAWDHDLKEMQIFFLLGPEASSWKRWPFLERRH